MEKEKQKNNTNKTTKYAIIGGIVAIILIAIVVAVCVIAFAAKPEKAVEGMLSALKEGNFQKAEEYVNYKELMNGTELTEEETEMDEETQKLLFDKLAWNIKEIKQEGDTATVEAEITNKDFKVVISNSMSKAIKAAFSNPDTTEEDVTNYIIEELKNEELQTRTVSTSIQVEKQDGKWKVVANEDLANSLLTGLDEAMKALNDMNIM